MGFLRYLHASGFVPPPGHNGGRSQSNFIYIQSGDWPFINVMKYAPLPIFSDNSPNTVSPDLLNADGYPLAAGSHGGFHWSDIPIPSQTERAGNYIITWDGTGDITGTGAGGNIFPVSSATFTGSITGNVLTIPGSVTGTIQLGMRVTGGTTAPYTFIMSGSGTTYTVSKSQTVASVAMTADGGLLTSSGSAGSGFYLLTIGAGIAAIQFKILTVGSPVITNVQIYNVNDAAQVAAGEIFGTELLFRLREANFGVLRFLNWHDNNVSNMTTWRTRKPITYATYNGDQLNPSLYAGTATHTSNAYVSSQFPAIHSSDGTAWTSGGPKEKDTVHVVWTNSATQSGTCSLSIGTSGVAVNILDSFGGPLAELGGGGFYPVGGTAQSLATLIYDTTLGGWIKHGGDAAYAGYGLHNVVPFEVCVQLCKEVGAHPYFLSPYLALDTATDLMAELAQYCKTYAAANAPWMIPRFEGPNETWNGNTFMTGYANRKATANWGAGVNYHDQYGKWLANLGQICAGVYGGSNLGLTYQVLCGVQTGSAPSDHSERLATTKYVAQAAAADPAITGSFGTISFTKQAAKLTTSHVTCAPYISPSGRFTINELVNGFAYSVTNKGNSSAQATLANSYCDGLLGAATPYNLAFVNADYVAYKAWGASYGVNKMCAYEGGWSPDYLPGSGLTEGGAWWSSPTGRTQVNPAIIQLTSACTNSELGGGTIAGNPGVAGMTVAFSSTGTQFDNPGLELVTFTAGSANISGANTLVLNQAVYFRVDYSSTFPAGMAIGLALTNPPAAVYSENYFVVSAGNPFQVSTTRGGTAVTFTTVGTGNIFAQECWLITSVDSVNNRVTLDCNSTGFTAPTGGYMGYCKSQVYSNNLRYAGKLSPNLQGYTYGGAISNYQNFLNAGGEFPSNYLIAGPALSGNAWIVLEPLEQSPNPPQWLAFIAFNH